MKAEENKMSNFDYFKVFLKDIWVAAALPSSDHCVEKVCQAIDFDKDFVLVEYGPGSGVFTKYLLDNMSKKSKIIAIETNDIFVNFLKDIGDDRLIVVQDTCENVKDIIAKHGIKQIDYALSGIPFAYLEERQKNQLVGNTKSILKEGGKFCVYQYTPNALKYLKKFFADIHKSMSFRLPVTRIWIATKE